MIKRKTFYLLIILVTGCIQVSAQKYFFKNFFLDDGLPQATVLSVYQDKRSHIWIGTQAGVAKYDGKSFMNFDTRHGLSGNHISTMFHDSKYRLWFGHRYEGLTLMKNNTFYKIPLTESLSNNLVSSIKEDSKGNIWISTVDHGIYILKEKNDTSFNYINLTKEKDFLDNHVTDILIKNDEIYVSSDTGLILITANEKLNSFKYKLVLSSHEIKSNIQSLAIDSSGYIWMHTYKGLVKVFKKKGKFEYTVYPFEKEFEIAYLDRITIDHENNIWGTSSDGIFKFNGKNYFYFNRSNGFLEKDANSIICDREGNIWVGGMSMGAFKYSGEKFMLFDEDKGLINNQVTSIVEDDNNIWFATEEGISLYNGTSYQTFPISNMLNSESISALFKDSRGNIWISTYSQPTIVRYNPKNNTHKTFTYENGVIDFILTINEDKQGNIWFGSLGYGVLKYTYPSPSSPYGKMENFTEDDGLCSNIIWIIHKDLNGDLWIGSDDRGISKVTENGFENITKKNGLPNERAAAMTNDLNNNIWIATIGDGVYKYDGKTFKNYSLDEGLGSDSPFCIICDDFNNIWVGTNTGIDKLDTNTGKFVHYGKEDGFLGIETNQNAVFKDDSGNLWFGTVNGAVKVNPRLFKPNQLTPTLVLEKIQLYYDDFNYLSYCDSIDQVTNLPINLSLPFKQNHITFYFSALSYTAPEKVQYKFKLEGFDEDWSPVSDMNKAIYTNIPPGQYTFKFKASNSDGFWNKKPFEFTFTIIPPFYQTTWFYVICIGFIIIVFNLIIYIRTRNINKSKKMLRKKVELRTDEILKQKEEIEAQRDALENLNTDLQGQQVQIIEKNEELKQQKEEILSQRDEIEKKSEILKRVNKIIESKNKHITDSIKYAKKIQDAILPQYGYLDNLINNHFILFLPKDIVSGDFYWFENKNGLIYVAAVDCTGHGVPGAFMSIIAHNLLNQALNEYKFKQPSEILNFISTNIKKGLHKKNIESSSVKAGLTITLCAIDLHSKILTYAAAQNSFFLLRDGTIQHYKGERFPIGMSIEENYTFADFTVELQENDIIYLFTDGFTDQFGGPKNRKLMYKGLKEKIIEISKYNLKKQEEILHEYFMLWKGAKDQIDDVLLIGLKI